MPFMHGKFKSGGGSSKPAEKPAPKEKIKAAPAPKHTGAHEVDAPSGDGAEKHVTETHPGQTQPHPVTGVHAFHAHHAGGGKYRSHTHHDGGQVETQDHPSHGDMQSAADAALPDDGMGEQPGMDGTEQDFSSQMGGVGGGTPDY